MSHCINPYCPHPQNPDNILFCQACGSELLLAGRYRVSRLLSGKGGFGRTYEVTQGITTKVLKVLINHQPKAIELFEQEARVLQQLNHPGIPKGDRYFTFLPRNSQQPLHCLVMERIEGLDLEEYQQQRQYRPIDQHLALEWLLQLAEILDEVHQQQFFHRDIKPSNIILRPDGQLVLIDFGTVRAVTATYRVKQQAGQVTGIASVGYTPPEQLNYQALPQSDFFALGRTFVFLLTGKQPTDPTIYDPLNDQLNWRSHTPYIVPELADFIDKLMMRSASQRPADTQVILQRLAEIDRILNPPSPPPPPRRKPSKVAATVPSSTISRTLQSFDFEVVTVDSQGRVTNRDNRQAEFFAQDLGNGLTIEMVAIPGDKFLMGSPATEDERRKNESPQHEVTVQAFFIGKYPVTQAQWKAVAALPQINRNLKASPSKFKGVNFPVEQVSWYDAVEFCARLSRETRRTYRLPSEAEWEYACRAGTKTPFHFGETITTDVANYNGNSTYGSGPNGEYRQKTTPVGSFQVANAFGLYDMHGNLWEWCADIWHSNYKGAPTDGSVWDDENENNYLFRLLPRFRLLRGGSWYYDPEYCRSACRLSNIPGDLHSYVIGFRVVCEAA